MEDCAEDGGYGETGVGPVPKVRGKGLSMLDSVILGVAPGYGARRIAARQAAGYIIGIGGGGYKGSRSTTKGLEGWNPWLDSAITALHPDIHDLRSRTRDLVRNSAPASAAQEQLFRSIVGGGLKVRPMVDKDAIGMDEAAATKWEADARRVFNLWSMAEGGCHMGRELSFADLQAHVFRGVFEGGDVLVLERWLPDRGAPFGTCYHLVEAERIGNPESELAMDTRKLAGGVEIDLSTEEVLAYHVRSEHPGESQTAFRWNRVAVRNDEGRRIARLVYRKIRIGERRGAPWLSVLIEPLKKMEVWTDTELRAAMVAACFTAFITNSTGPGFGPLGPHGQPLFPGVDPGGDTAARDRADKDDRDIKLDEGLIVELRPGEDVKTADPNRPNREFAGFMEHMLMHIGMQLGVPYEVLTMKYQSSYSAAKGAIGEAWRTFSQLRQWMAREFCQPAYEAVLLEAVMKGMLDAPDEIFTNPLFRMAYCNAMWVGGAMPPLDPDKEITAAGKRVKLGVSTVDSEAVASSGATFEEILAQRKKETAGMATLTPPAPQAGTEHVKDDKGEGSKSKESGQ